MAGSNPLCISQRQGETLTVPDTRTQQSPSEVTNMPVLSSKNATIAMYQPKQDNNQSLIEGWGELSHQRIAT